MLSQGPEEKSFKKNSSLNRFLKTQYISRLLTGSLILTTTFIAAIAIALIFIHVTEKEEKELQAKADDYLSFLSVVIETPLWDLKKKTIQLLGETVAKNELVIKLIIKDAYDRTYFSFKTEQDLDGISRSGKVFHEGVLIGEIELLLTKKFYKESVRRLLFTVIISTLLFSASLALVTGLLIRELLKKPLSSLNEIVDSYAAGIYDPIDVQIPYREFKPFGTVLSQMGRAIKKHQTHLEERTTQLVKSNKAAEVDREKAEAANMAKSDFLARMSHEIRTPLNAVTGLTNIVLKSELTAEQRNNLNKVQIASNNLLEVINDILDFSKVEACRLELKHAPFDLDQILEQLADLFSDQVAKKDLELILAVAPDVPRQLGGDAGRLTQVLTNLVANAVKFTDTGEIIVGVKPDDQADQRTKKAALKFRVSDTGIGIAADVLPTLFDPFTQADSYLTRKHEGAGLGLAICERLVELMGGRIWVDSKPGKGSTFYFTVNLEIREEEKPRYSPPMDLHGLKILVVDDSAMARQVLGDLLESFTFNVSAVDRGEKAILALRRAASGEPYKMVLLDCQMPGMDGFETATSIRNDPALLQPHIIMVTVYSPELMQERMDTATADIFLQKPVKPSQLFNTIMELLGQAEAAVPSREKQMAGRTIQRLAGQRVLVVEDSELNRDVAMALLEEAGLAVETAENGRIAVDKVTESPKGYYDAVLMDIQMPVMDGYEATKKIREFENQQVANSEQPKARTPIIALTAHALEGEKEKCLAADMDDYLTKPLDEQDMHRVLLKWIESQQGPFDAQTILDVQGALKRLGGRRQIYIKALTKFAPECGKAHNAIVRHLDAGDRETASRIAHTVKGMASAIGVDGLSQVAAELETAIADEGTDIDSLLSIFKSKIEQTLGAVDRFVEAENMSGDQMI